MKNQVYIESIKTLSTLNEFESLLVERQQMHCSPFILKVFTDQLEDHIRKKVSEIHPPSLRSDVEVGLENIFRGDDSCAFWLSNPWSADNRKDGGLMWKYLENWRNKAKKSVQDES